MNRPDMPRAAASLDALPVKNGFRLRGVEMTRLETFTDAAFAFAVTLLVISVDAMPSTYDELVTALRALPIFGASFVMLMLFWYGHWSWSRRFGLEDTVSIVLSLGLVFTVLSFVYPLKFVWALLTYWLSDGALAPEAALDSPDQLRVIFAVYGAAFVAMSLILVGLNAHALRQEVEPALSRLERIDTWGDAVAWLILAGIGGLSALTALSGIGPPASAAWLYMLLPVLMPAWGIAHGLYRSRVLAASPSGDGP